MPMKVSTHLHPHTPLGPAAAWSRTRERMGFYTLWYGEAKYNPFLSCLLMAQNTEHVQFGPNVTVAFARSPHVMANEAWDLQAYSGGRFVLGMGTQVKGHNERRFSVPWGPPMPRLREYIECMRAIWDSWQNGTKPNYEGKYYRYQLTSWNFNPGPIEHPDIPVMIAAVKERNTALAGSHCDGILFHGFMSFKWKNEILMPILLDSIRKSGRDPKDFIIHGGGFVVTGRDQAELDQQIAEQRRWLAFYASTRTYHDSMRMSGFADEAAQLHRMSIDGEWDKMTAIVTDDMLDAYCVIGTWDEMPRKMHEKFAGINTEISFSPDIRTPDDEAQVHEIVAKLHQIPSYGEVAPVAALAPTA